jgi:5'-nucleotidase
LAVDHVHNHGDLKRLTVENMEEYVIRDDRLATLFNRMHENNAKVFLLTNSGYDYTDVSLFLLVHRLFPEKKVYF